MLILLLENSFRLANEPTESTADLQAPSRTPQKRLEIKQKVIDCAVCLATLDHLCNEFRNTDNGTVVVEFDSMYIRLIIALSEFREAQAKLIRETDSHLCGWTVTFEPTGQSLTEQYLERVKHYFAMEGSKPNKEIHNKSL